MPGKGGGSLTTGLVVPVSIPSSSPNAIGHLFRDEGNAYQTVKHVITPTAASGMQVRVPSMSSFEVVEAAAMINKPRPRKQPRAPAQPRSRGVSVALLASVGVAALALGTLLWVRSVHNFLQDSGKPQNVRTRVPSVTAGIEDVEGSQQKPVSRGAASQPQQKQQPGQQQREAPASKASSGSHERLPAGSGSTSSGSKQQQQQQRPKQPKQPKPKQQQRGQRQASQRRQQGQPELLTYRIVREYPHDGEAFTQGLQFDRICSGGGGSECRDIFWESTGLNGHSSVREVEVESGKVLRKSLLPNRDFGEGVTRLGDRLYMVTWRSPRTWSFATSNFSDAQLLRTPLSDGWGITTDGKHLIVGDSSETLTFLDPASMGPVRSVRVMDAGKPVVWLNELEWVEGQILANIWQTECMTRIDPESGAVTAWVSFKGLRQNMVTTLLQQGAVQPQMRIDVLNGIAWDAEGRRLFVTGKLWPRLYQVELVPLETNDPEGTLAQLREECIVKHTSFIG